LSSRLARELPAAFGKPTANPSDEPYKNELKSKECRQEWLVETGSESETARQPPVTIVHKDPAHHKGRV
jgi:hypothetical protein